MLPLGLSFFIFKAISYLVDIYQKKIKVSINPVNMALYLSCFTQIQSGPLSRYNDMYVGRKLNFSQFSDGVFRFIIGFNKKILLSNTLAHITQETFAADAQMSVSYAWLGSICFSLQLFFDFAGYSDMAIGLSEMFGMYCPENFKYPYMSVSISEFWRRWHITLGMWFRDYIYIPLGGSRVASRLRLYMNLMTVWLLTGLWHGASWNFIVWGMLYFIAIAVEKASGYPDKIKSRFLKSFYRIWVVLFINFQWVIFRAGGLRVGLKYIRCMFWTPANALADFRALFLLKDNWIYIIAAIILCFPIGPWIEKQCKKKECLHILWNVGVLITNAAFFLIAVSYVVAGQNNPFLYANF